MKRFLFTLLAAALCLTSCMSTKEILYRGQMFGTMKGVGVMLGDDGRNYRFNNNDQMTTNMPASGRIVAIFDVYSLMEGTSNDYEAELLDYVVPLCKEPVVCTTAEEELALGDAPVALTDGVWGGGHLNMLCTALMLPNSSATHTIDLQIVPSENADTLHTILRHNSGEDIINDLTRDSFAEYPFYASFPLDEYLPEGKSTVLEVKYLWDEEWHSVYATISK